MASPGSASKEKERSKMDTVLERTTNIVMHTYSKCEQKLYKRWRRIYQASFLNDHLLELDLKRKECNTIETKTGNYRGRRAISRRTRRTTTNTNLQKERTKISTQ